MSQSNDRASQHQAIWASAILSACAVALFFPSGAYAVQFNILDPGYVQEIYAAPLIPNQEAGMAWTSSNNLLTRAGSTIVEYGPTQNAVVNGTNVHAAVATHTITGLAATGYGMANGMDGYIYTATGTGVQRFDPNNWAAPAQSLAGTVGGNGWGITTLTDGRIAYSDGGATSNIYIYDPVAATNTLIYTAPELVDDIEAGPSGAIALAGHQPTGSIFIISNTGSPINSFATPAHFPDGLAFGDGASSNSLFSNNNDGSITEYALGPGYSGVPIMTDIALQTTAAGKAYGDLAAVGPDCSFYVSQYNNNGSNGSTFGTGTHWDDGSTTADASIVRISAVGSDGSPICLFYHHTETVPEPGTLVLAALGMAGLGVFTARKKFRQKRPSMRCLGSLALVVLCSWTSVALATPYTFMSVSGTNVPGNGTAVSTFTSSLGNGIITVDHNSTTPNSLGNWGTQDNINSAINPSKFATLFPGSGNVQGHLAQSMYGDPNAPPGTPNPIPNVTTVTFHLNTYTGYLPTLAFGIWNTTTEVGSPVYNVQFMDASNAIVSPSTVSILGNDDNTGSGGVLGLHQMLFTPSSGDITFSNAILNASGIHTDALFFDGIPVGTKEIIVTATLPSLNSLGDGVGYYFAETPEPSTLTLTALGLLGLGFVTLRKKLRRA